MALQNKISLRILAGVIALLLAAGGIALIYRGFQEIIHFQFLERIPQTTLEGSVGGEAQLEGKVVFHLDKLTSPHTNSQCIYYRYLIEEERTDSEGKKKWVTIRDDVRSIDFLLRDSSAEALVKSSNMNSVIDFYPAKKHYNRSGDRRYTEWRIDPDDNIRIFGWLDQSTTPWQVSFTAKGDYIPILGFFSSQGVREDMGGSAVFILWGGVSLIVMFCYLLMFALRWHRTLTFLAIASFSITLPLMSVGFSALEMTVESGAERASNHQQKTDSLIREYLTRRGIETGNSELAGAYQGLHQPFDLNNVVFSGLTDEDRERINSWRNTSYDIKARYSQQIDRFPENTYALLRRLHDPGNIQLPADQLSAAQARIAGFSSTQTQSNPFIVVIGVVILLVTAFFAFRTIKVKRIQENVPTSKAAGATYGLTELAGELLADDDKEPFTGPLSRLPCVWYHYTVQEKRGSGKNASWVTIEDDTKKQPFYCEDDSGRMRVFPGQAEIITKQTKTKREGRYLYREIRLSPGDQLYLLGHAKPDRTRGDTLVMNHEKGLPYIISNYTEEEVMFSKANSGMLLLSVGISAVFLVCFWLSATAGNFSALDFLLLSLIAPIFFSIQMLMLMFNDLIFLKNRCDRNWANIQVSLKKRATLIPKLVQLVRVHMAHEKDLQTKLSELRETAANPPDSSQAVDQFMATETRIIDQLRARMEDYPDIKSQEMSTELTDRLVKLENEVALIRDGFNDAVTMFNTRIETFPDLFLARIARFGRKDLLLNDSSPHPIRVDLSS